MDVTTFSSREFNQNASAVRKASDTAPVFITVRGEPKTVMLSYDDYQRLVEKPKQRTLYDVFSVPGFEKMDTDIDLESSIPRQYGKAAEFD